MSKPNKENISQKVNKIADKVDKTLSKVTKLDDSYEEYTDQEIKYIDKYKMITGESMSDEDLYEIIIKHNFDDYFIKKEVDEQMKLLEKRGDEYAWAKIENGKSKKIFLS